jgi:hypothetical protein
MSEVGRSPRTCVNAAATAQIGAPIGEGVRAADRVDEDAADQHPDRHGAERHDPRRACDPADELVG